MTATQAVFWRDMMQNDASKRGKGKYYANAIRFADLILRGESFCGETPEYKFYRMQYDDGNGNDWRNGKPLQTYGEWLDGFRIDFTD